MRFFCRFEGARVCQIQPAEDSIAASGLEFSGSLRPELLIPTAEHHRVVWQ